jgi:hypothetical protein
MKSQGLNETFFIARGFTLGFTPYKLQFTNYSLQSII